MRRLIAAIAFGFIFGGCGPNYDGRYPIDSMRMMSEGPRVTTLVSETFPLDAWFEIQSGTLLPQRLPDAVAPPEADIVSG